MKNRITLISAILLLSATGAAYSADPIVAVQPNSIPTNTSYNWNGSYIGGQIGHSWTKTKYAIEHEDDVLGTANTKNKKAFIGGVYAGYNFDLGNNIILGADLDVAKGFQPQKNILTSDDSSESVSTELGWNGAVRARMGYAVDRVMPFVAGGLALGKITNTLKASEDETFSKAKVRAGWTLGGGVDYAATDNIILRVEYRYTDFGKQNFDFGEGVSANSKLSSNDVRVGVAYKF